MIDLIVTIVLLLIALFWLACTIMAVNDPTKWDRRQQAFGAAVFSFLATTFFWVAVLT